MIWMARGYAFAHFRSVTWTYRQIWCSKVFFPLGRWNMVRFHVPKILSRLMVGIILYTYAQYLRDYHVYHLSLSSLEITMNQPLSGISHDFPLGFRHFSTLLMSFFGDAKTPLRSWRIRRSCTSSKQRPSLMRMKIQRYECWQVVDLDLFEMPVDHR